MKKITLLFTLLLSVFITQAQDIDFTFANFQVTNDGTNDFLEIDVLIAETSGNPFKLVNGQMYFNYNTAAFGSQVFANNKITITYPTADGYIYGQLDNALNAANIYNAPGIEDNTNSRVSVTFLQFYSSVLMTGPNVTAIPTKLFHLKLEFTDVNQDPLLCFEIGGVYLDLFFTACGGTAGGILPPADCTNFPGTQIFNDTFDCSGAVAACSGGTTTWSETSPGSGIGGWDNGVPDNTKNAIINFAYGTTAWGSIDACSLTITPTGLLEIDPNTYVKVEEDIVVDASGYIAILHKGSLVQVNNSATVTNNGVIGVTKTTPTLTNRDFTILSSPMSGETVSGVYTSAVFVRHHITGNFVPHPLVEAENPLAGNWADDNGDNWLPHSAALTVGEGYLVKPFAITPVTTGTFTTNYTQGTLNNGYYSVLPIWNGSRNASPNILGNPYASAIDATAFLNDNLLLASNVYFWEHITAPSTYPGYNLENYNMGDISIMNVTGLGTAAPNDVTMTPPSQFIPSGQGFGVKIKIDPAGLPFQFDNSQRVTGPNTGYRTQDSNLEKLYIYLKNETYNLRSSMAIAFTDQATNDYDEVYETKRLATPISIYSVIDEHELVIQARNVFTTDQVIPLGFRTMVEENQTYTISLGTIEGDNVTQATVYLQDNLLDIVTNLSEGNYTFTSNESNQKDRFVIVFADEQLGAGDVSLEAVAIYPNPTVNFVNIVSPIATITNVAVYDVRGRMIATNTVANQSSFKLDLTSYNSAMYFVEIETTSGKVTKQVIRK